MANNIVETIQKSLGFPALQKIDPNIQEAKDHSRQAQEKLGQAAIPAVLTALYRFSRVDEGGKTLLSQKEAAGWLAVLFEGKEAEAIDKVARYAGVTPKEAGDTMEKVAAETVTTVKKLAGPDPTPETVRSLMNAQRHHILVYLPAALQMGDLLNEEMLDDRTNKMEGPVSNLMHAIENRLSDSDESRYP